MKHSDQLSVKPVRRYSKPKYPSHQDPDPTLYPDPVPYPINRKALSAIAASASVLFSTACRPTEDGQAIADPAEVSSVTTSGSNALQDGEAESLATILDKIEDALTPPTPPKNFDQLFRDELNTRIQSLENDPFGDGEVVMDADETGRLRTVTPEERKAQFRAELIEKAGGNPFCIAVSGLPHRTSGFGTGLPQYVKADFARRVMEQVFGEAGFELKSNVQYDRDGVAFVMDGYDAKNKIGFVIGDYHNLDDDAVLSWAGTTASAKGGDQYAVEIDMLERMYSSDPSKAKLVSEIQAAKRQVDPAKRMTAFKIILDKRDKKLLSLKEINELHERAKRGEDFVAVISQFDQRFTTPWSVQLMEEEIIEFSASGSSWNSDARKELILKKKAQTVMEQLEKTARDYIRWAQAQGLG